MSAKLLASLIITCTSAQVENGYLFQCGGYRIRIESIVTAELPSAAECIDHRRNYAWCNYRAGYRARDALKAFLSRGPVLIKRSGTDRYGRVLAKVSVNGQDVGEYLKARGLAKSWR